MGYLYLIWLCEMPKFVSTVVCICSLGGELKNSHQLCVVQVMPDERMFGCVMWAQARDVFTWLGLRLRGSVFATVSPLLLTMVGTTPADDRNLF